MTPRIQEAIDVFLDAINKGRLAKGDCSACAVGNLVAHGMGLKSEEITKTFDPNSEWVHIFYTSGKEQTIKPFNFDYEPSLKCIRATKFTLKELMAIEYAFETNTEIDSSIYRFTDKETIRKDQINGLAAVVKVMLTFDDCKESVEEVFIKKANLIPV